MNLGAKYYTFCFKVNNGCYGDVVGTLRSGNKILRKSICHGTCLAASFLSCIALVPTESINQRIGGPTSSHGNLAQL